MSIPHDLKERAFRSAQTWPQFVESMTVNRSAIEANFAAYELTTSDKSFLKGLPGVSEVLVLAHDWCGDVVANLPLFAKIETETGKLRLHIVPKDPDNVDIGKLYPHADGEVHIPIYVFFDAQGREKGHLIERTPALNSKVGQWFAEFWESHPEADGKGKEFSALAPEVKQALIDHLNSERRKVRDLEKSSILQALGKILA